MIFVGTCAGNFECIGRTRGEALWSQDTREGRVSSQFHGDMLLYGDAVIVGTDGAADGFIWAFDRGSGAVRWRYPAGRGVASGVVGHDGLVYAGTLQEELLCLDPVAGELLWSFAAESGETPRLGHLTPLLAGDTVVWGAAGTGLFALDAGTGEVRWREYLSAPVRTNPLLREGDVFVGTEDGFVQRLRLADGEPVMEYFVDGDPYGDLVPAAGNLLLFVDWMQPAGALVSFDPEDGAFLWSQAAPDTATWTTKRPFLIGDRVLAGTDRGEVFAFDVRDGTRTRLLELDAMVRSFAFSEGCLYVGTLDGSLRALRYGSR